VVSLLSIGPKICRFNPGWGRWILMAIKIRCMTSFGGEVKPLTLCRTILRHVKEPYGNERDTA
jgi:hypothetical protein